MMASHELLQGLIYAALTSSVAIVLVLLLRRPFRKAFGAQVAYALWGLVPMAVLATLLPSASEEGMRAPLANVLVLPTVSAAAAVPVQGAFDWGSVLLALWLAGAVLTAIWLWQAQRTFRRGLGQLLPHGGVLRAQSRSAGLPATMGLWRPQIVLPADFETRFEADQRVLVLAHERRHIARLDPWSNALAALLRCLFWCNPLFLLAERAFRHDQELACDADVIASQPQLRRRYGDALLTTQLTLQTAPLGCHLGFGHPLKERIAMLCNASPSATRRLSGTILVSLLGCAVAFSAWASQPQQVAAAATATPPAGTVDAASRIANPPEFPADALKDGVTGTVVLVVDIDAQGHVTGLAVERSSGDARLDSAALSAAARWRFHPAREHGKPAASKVRVPVEFAKDKPADAAQAAG